MPSHPRPITGSAGQGLDVSQHSRPPPFLGPPLLRASPFPNSLRVLTILTTLRTIPALPTSSVFKMALTEEETEVQRVSMIWSKKTHSMDRIEALPA